MKTIIKAWAIINRNGKFVSAHWNEILAEMAKEECDKNWDTKEAKVVPCQIKLINLTKKKS